MSLRPDVRFTHIKPHQVTRLAPRPQSSSVPAVPFRAPVSIYPPFETLVESRADLKRRGTRLESPPKRGKRFLGSITEEGEARCPAPFIIDSDDSCEEGERSLELAK
jgi:hypothetical protein